MWAERDERWNFGRKRGVGFGAVVGLTMRVGVTTTRALLEVVSSRDRVLEALSITVGALLAAAVLTSGLVGNTAQLATLSRDRSKVVQPRAA